MMRGQQRKVTTIRRGKLTELQTTALWIFEDDDEDFAIVLQTPPRRQPSAECPCGHDHNCARTICSHN